MEVTQLDPDVETHLRAASSTCDYFEKTSGVLPDGFHHLVRQMIISLGTARFADATQALFGQQVHLRSVLRVATSSAGVRHEALVMRGIGAGPFTLSPPYDLHAETSRGLSSCRSATPRG